MGARRQISTWAVWAVVVALLAGCSPVVAPASSPVRAPQRATTLPRPTSLSDRLDGREVGVSLYGSVLGWSRADLRRDLDRVRAMGATWVRVPFNWVTLEMHGRGQYNWGPGDAIVDEANARHLRVLAVVSYTPGWARPAGRPGTDPPTDLDDYARFMRAAATRYSPRGVHHWEVWNEPNLDSMWTPQPNAAKYTALLKKAYPAIKQADPRAVVLSAGLSPGYDAPDGSQIAPLTFVQRIYGNGGGPYFDAIGHHPSTYPYRSTYRASWSAFQQTATMFNIMRAHGDAQKKIWATEIGFPTGTNPRAVSEANQASYLLESLRTWTRYAYTGPVFVYSMRDEGPNRADHYQNFGLVRTSGTANPASLVLRRALGR